MPLLHRALAALRYVDLCVCKKRVAWHLARTCALVLAEVLPRPPSAQSASALAQYHTKSLQLAAGQLLLRPSEPLGRLDGSEGHVSLHAAVVDEASGRTLIAPLLPLDEPADDVSAEAPEPSPPPSGPQQQQPPPLQVGFDELCHVAVPWRAQTGDALERLARDVRGDVEAIASLIELAQRLLPGAMADTAENTAPTSARGESCSFDALRRPSTSSRAESSSFDASALDVPLPLLAEMARLAERCVSAVGVEFGVHVREAVHSVQLASIQLAALHAEVAHLKETLGAARAHVAPKQAALQQRRRERTLELVGAGVETIEVKLAVFREERRALIERHLSLQSATATGEQQPGGAQSSAPEPAEASEAVPAAPEETAAMAAAAAAAALPPTGAATEEAPNSQQLRIDAIDAQMADLLSVQAELEAEAAVLGEQARPSLGFALKFTERQRWLDLVVAELEALSAERASQLVKQHTLGFQRADVLELLDEEACLYTEVQQQHEELRELEKLIVLRSRSSAQHVDALCSQVALGDPTNGPIADPLMTP